MTYKISNGLPESDLEAWLKKALNQYGLYENRGVNFTNAEVAPVVMCTVIYKGKILLAKRGFGLADAEGYWSTINGFIDEIKPVKEVAQQELREELNLAIDTDHIKVGKSYSLSNPKEKRSYIVFPCLVMLKSQPIIALDREHTEYKWITRDQLESYDILEDLPYAIDQAMALQ